MYCFHCQILSQPTHVYVRNCTPLRFDISIKYESAHDKACNFCQKSINTIAPFDIPTEKNMVLSIDRLLPQGEHLYTIQLMYGVETLNLKQKLISISDTVESELGVSLESMCLHDPWFMNSQAKERHEHLLTINGHTIIVVYYAYDTDNGEDIAYTLHEKFELSAELATQAHLLGKKHAYSIAIPVILRPLTNSSNPRLRHSVPSTLQHLMGVLLSSKKFISISHDSLVLLARKYQSSNFSASGLPDAYKISRVVEHKHELMHEEQHGNSEEKTDSKTTHFKLRDD